MWRMCKQDAGPATVQRSASQDRPEALGVTRIAVMYADNLEAIDGHLLVVQHADAGAFDGLEVFRGVRELFVVTGHEIGAERR